MVFKIVDKNSSGYGDLFNPIDFYGTQNDTVMVMMPTPYTNTIKTYGGNDYVEVVGTTKASYVANIFYLGSGTDKLAAGNGSENYYDESGDDKASMGGGNDYVIAGLGNDRIDGGDGKDLVSFNRIIWTDDNLYFVTEGLTFDLAVKTVQNLGVFGSDIFTNFEDVQGTWGNDNICGSSTANSLRGDRGADHLYGRSGHDSLYGGEGTDIIVGGNGGDNLWGGNGTEPDGEADVFIYTTASESSLTHFDTIWDFENSAGGGLDKIDLSAIDASSVLSGNNGFVFVGSGPFTSTKGEVSVHYLNGNTVVTIDTDGDAMAEMMIVLKGVNGLTAEDFVL